MSLSLAVLGIPGPKGSVNTFCLRCAKRNLKQMIVVKEQSENGVKFRAAIRGAALKALPLDHEAYSGPIETRITVYIPRQRVIKRGVVLNEWVPSHSTPVPIHQQSGDVEKHVRCAHDALADAGVMVNDCQVWRQVIEKQWADEEHSPGAHIEILLWGES